MVVNVYLIRHGESESNCEQNHEKTWKSDHVKSSEKNPPLTPKGVEQSKRTGQFLNKCDLGTDVYYFCSTLKRAINTANAVSSTSYWNEKDYLVEWVPAIESRESLLARINQFLNEIGSINNLNDSTIIMVGHSMFISVF
jgi:broad specificity phosphatase PhoE